MTKDIKIVEKLRSISKNFFSVADLVKILEQSKPEIYTVLSRLTKRGVLVRIAQGYYAVYGEPLNEDAVASQIYYPSYISLETVLARNGWLNQIPRVLTMVTTNKSKKIKLLKKTVRYRQIKKKCFFGYFEKESAWIAYPEKALLDKLYYVYRGRASIDFSELDTSGIKKSRWTAFKKRYPVGLKGLIDKAEKRIIQQV